MMVSQGLNLRLTSDDFKPTAAITVYGQISGAIMIGQYSAYVEWLLHYWQNHAAVDTNTIVLMRTRTYGRRA
jgi:hypothetical protein